MKYIFSPTMFKTMCIALLLFTAYSCKEDTVTPSGPEANTISGTVTFTDTNFITSGGYYDIGIFPNPSTPPAYWFGPPSANDTLIYTRSGNVYKASYVLRGVSNGDYVVAVGFRKHSGGQSPIMGVYGCDTARFINGSTCFLNPQRISITNNAGRENVNFLSWADTTKKVF
ncbi:MAG: hypothetical protein M3P82_02570 [Bacteroidota bacterium]|nr:hypothetical protein [Bacteroidota bacterium]